MDIKRIGADICIFCQKLEIEKNNWDAVEHTCKFSEYKKYTDKCPIFERKTNA